MSNRSADLKLVKESFLKDLVIVTGAESSGKSLLAPLVTSLQGAENFRMSILLEHLGALNHLGRLSDDVLVFLLRYTVDFMLYDNMVGRDMNFRFEDETSIWNTPDPEKYFERLLAERGEFVIDEIEKKRPLLVLALSDAFWHAKRWFEAFPFLKMIHISRHPVDIVDAWYEEIRSMTLSAKRTATRDGFETYNSKINQVLLIRVNNRIVPHYALGWEEKYAELSDMDRVIYMIKGISANCAMALNSLSGKERKRLLFLTLDETITNTEHILAKVCSFLDTARTPYTSAVLKRVKCPRLIPEGERKNTFDKIKRLASDKALNLLMSMVQEFEGGRI